ncbi:MAG: hypothetical protein ACYDEY_04610 [Acidimicrobiales bacterium]
MEKTSTHLSEELVHQFSSIKDILAMPSSPPASRDVVRTAIVPVTLSGADYRRAHALTTLPQVCETKRSTGYMQSGKLSTTPASTTSEHSPSPIPREEHTLYAHTTEAIGYDLYEAIKTSRTNHKNGMRMGSLGERRTLGRCRSQRALAGGCELNTSPTSRSGGEDLAPVLALANVEDPANHTKLVSPEF